MPYIPQKQSPWKKQNTYCTLLYEKKHKPHLELLLENTLNVLIIPEPLSSLYQVYLHIFLHIFFNLPSCWMICDGKVRLHPCSIKAISHIFLPIGWIRDQQLCILNPPSVSSKTESVFSNYDRTSIFFKYFIL